MNPKIKKPLNNKQKPPTTSSFHLSSLFERQNLFSAVFTTLCISLSSSATAEYDDYIDGKGVMLVNDQERDCIRDINLFFGSPFLFLEYFFSTLSNEKHYCF